MERSFNLKSNTLLEGNEKLGKKILLADDDNNVIQLSARILEDMGFRVDTVGNGEALLKKLTSGKYDLVITDNNMPPGITGVEALRKIRANSHFRNLPVIVNSGDKIKEIVENSGGVYFMKGDPMVDFSETVNKALSASTE